MSASRSIIMESSHKSHHYSCCFQRKIAKRQSINTFVIFKERSQKKTKYQMCHRDLEVRAQIVNKHISWRWKKTTCISKAGRVAQACNIPTLEWLWWKDGQGLEVSLGLLEGDYWKQIIWNDLAAAYTIKAAVVTYTRPVQDQASYKDQHGSGRVCQDPTLSEEPGAQNGCWRVRVTFLWGLATDKIFHGGGFHSHEHIGFTKLESLG